MKISISIAYIFKKIKKEMGYFYNPNRCRSIGNAFGNLSKNRKNKLLTDFAFGIVTLSGSDHMLSWPCVSFATTFIPYVPLVVHVFCADAVAPLLNGPTQPLVVPSPQSNM